MRMAPGSSFGHYTIESCLGEGGSGVVYLALDLSLGRKIALKLLTLELSVDPDFRSRFIAEARSAAALDHPHILPVYDAGEQDGQLYLAMRYVPALDLGKVIARDGVLPLERMVRILGQLAAALDAAHAGGVVHRDVKPTNVLLAPAEHAYLADFGLARLTNQNSGGLTRAGQLVGSVDYIAPELLSGASASARSDIYALGCLVMECVTGSPPFRRHSEVATLYAQAHDPPPVLGALRPDLPSGLDAVLRRALAKNPEERYGTAAEFADAVTNAAREPVAAVSLGVISTSSASREGVSTVRIAKPKRIQIVRLLIVALLSVLVFSAAAIALLASDRAARGLTTPSPVLPAAESTVSPTLRSTPSASPTPVIVSLALEALILPLNEFPFPGHEIESTRAVLTNGLVRSFNVPSPIRAFREQSLMLTTYPTVESARRGLGSSCVEAQVLNPPSVGDSTKACLLITRAPTVTAMVDVWASALNVTVFARVVPSDVAAASEALERATAIARAQVARLEQLARESNAVQFAAVTPMPSVPTPRPPGCTAPAPASVPPPGFRFMGCTANDAASNYTWAGPGTGITLSRHPRGTTVGYDPGTAEPVDINGYTGALWFVSNYYFILVWWDSASTFSLTAGPNLTREIVIAFARSVH